jgi:regulator of protease activity HflC (stomatin/prohibitin superfamily)
MVGFIFGIIFIIVGIVVGIVLATHKKTVETEEYVTDDKGQPIKSAYGYITKTKKTVKKPYVKYSPIAYISGVFLGILLTFFGCITSVDTGKTGVVTTFGKVENYTLEAGFHLKAPWHSVTEMDNRVQKTTVELSCFSSDIQEVSMKYTLNYQIDKANAQEIYRTVGVDYYATIVEPNIAEAVKVATAHYTAEQLVQTRSDLANDIETLLETNLGRYNIKVSSTAIEDMDFTDAFTNAVEAKQVAEQKKKQAEIEQAQQLAQAENDKRIAETNAQAAAEVAKIQAAADAEVAKIAANSAEYQGQKEAAIALQRLASINGWIVKTEKIDENTTKYTVCYADGTTVSPEDLKIGTQRLIEYYYTQAWDGQLPDTFVGDGDVSSIIIGNN